MALVAGPELLDLPIVPVLWDRQRRVGVCSSLARSGPGRAVGSTVIGSGGAWPASSPIRPHIELLPVGNPTGFRVYDLRISGPAQSVDDASHIEIVVRELFDHDADFDGDRASRGERLRLRLSRRRREFAPRSRVWFGDVHIR